MGDFPQSPPISFLSPLTLKLIKGVRAVERFDLKTISERHPCLNSYIIAVLHLDTTSDVTVLRLACSGERNKNRMIQ